MDTLSEALLFVYMDLSFTPTAIARYNPNASDANLSITSQNRTNFMNPNPTPPANPSTGVSSPFPAASAPSPLFPGVIGANSDGESHIIVHLYKAIIKL